MVARARAGSAVATKRPATRNNSWRVAPENSPDRRDQSGAVAGGEAVLCQHVNEAHCTAGFQPPQCPLWVRSGKARSEHYMSALPPKTDIERRDRHVRQ